LGKPRYNQIKQEAINRERFSWTGGPAGH